MNDINWCLKQKNGIELIEPNNNLVEAYVKKAENSLRASAVLEDNIEWRISSSYYAMYFSLYAIFMKIGIKCEIHSCSVVIMNVFLNEYFNKKEMELLKKSMKARIDTQYYTDRSVSDLTYNIIITGAPIFLVNCKEILHKITEKKINKIRKQILELS